MQKRWGINLRFIDQVSKYHNSQVKQQIWNICWITKMKREIGMDNGDSEDENPDGMEYIAIT